MLRGAVGKAETGRLFYKWECCRLAWPSPEGVPTDFMRTSWEAPKGIRQDVGCMMSSQCPDTPLSTESSGGPDPHELLGLTPHLIQPARQVSLPTSKAIDAETWAA